ncbi:MULTISPECIES: tRNA (adenosine(37)-N6)-threonylcarbamoyltransferase complex transferase subunit TsaD [Thermodesulfobacterium]|jgi:N6-L-threonylcarbamoyladenine synthase|uniref:tRNA N6-adenosine threonylcarbamoyltransferase n=2 Tax=Thermodesulfobacterium commune TaxID=1741 RepID=A0A075WTK1_9BACT|nr:MULTISPECIES: tRNA (adenosine(37)-N6)-threonylcarbamoyltransferase complex transferase subunit TsaD [Thermodesulfobacterium]EDX27569.1 probable O-sialoglycoprotein endopeptidase [Escherichia coli B171]KUJ97749.1 MAG: putative tRNA threonylcarbamoyladenosine biosynthesis protein Gcp [Thermodesulfobacterium sp. 37_54]KUK19568.1 MAG: putative tRNA threonylcarbamoyladenosine biosynthesis protein Gcp [Thermodesulfobacterium commune]AIH03718.1 O-sialoglycoprotein endopeptidase [Thermodesulfobacter
MLLAIETSCDETGVALFSEDGKLISHLLYSQVAIHSPFGGIVPEIASRKQLEVLYPLIKELLKQNNIEISQLKAVAATFGPGLIGSLLVGVSLAKAISFALKIPLIAVDHLQAHLLAVFLEKEIEFPFIGLLVSGGHTALFLINSFFEFYVIGHTKDDAAGEAFDKVAKLLGLPYPGGPIISQLAEKGDPKAINLPRPLLEDKSLDFSFSGLKTAVLNYIKNHSYRVEDLCAGFEEAVCDVLVYKTFRAVDLFKVPRVVVAGGVAANKRLRQRFREKAFNTGVEIYFPSLEFCTDNAAMVGLLGYKQWQEKKYADLNTEAYARAVFKKLSIP